MLIVESIAKGCIFDVDNIYRWKELIFNLPAMEIYNPTLPWVYKKKKMVRLQQIYIFISMMVVQRLTLLGNREMLVEGLVIL